MVAPVAIKIKQYIKHVDFSLSSLDAYKLEGLEPARCAVQALTLTPTRAK